MILYFVVSNSKRKCSCENHAKHKMNSGLAHLAIWSIQEVRGWIYQLFTFYKTSLSITFWYVHTLKRLTSTITSFQLITFSEKIRSHLKYLILSYMIYLIFDLLNYIKKTSNKNDSTSSKVDSSNLMV